MSSVTCGNYRAMGERCRVGSYPRTHGFDVTGWPAQMVWSSSDCAGLHPPPSRLRETRCPRPTPERPVGQDLFDFHTKTIGSCYSSMNLTKEQNRAGSVYLFGEGLA
jgi:hypothetical protein